MRGETTCIKFHISASLQSADTTLLISAGRGIFTEKTILGGDVEVLVGCVQKPTLPTRSCQSRLVTQGGLVLHSVFKTCLQFTTPSGFSSGPPYYYYFSPFSSGSFSFHMFPSFNPIPGLTSGSACLHFQSTHAY